MTPLEEQVEKVARELNLEAGRQRGLSDVDDWDYITEQERGGWRNMAKTAIAVLLPLEVTDESVTVTFDRDIAEALERGITASFFPEENILRSHAYRLIHAALTQPQTEGRPGYPLDEDGDGKGVPMFADEGAATAAGVADADLEAAAMEISVKATRLDPETYKVPDKLIWMLRSALFPNEDMERIKSPGPYAKAFRERVCPVPEFPGIRHQSMRDDNGPQRSDSGAPNPDPAPVPQTEGEDK